MPSEELLNQEEEGTQTSHEDLEQDHPLISLARSIVRYWRANLGSGKNYQYNRNASISNSNYKSLALPANIDELNWEFAKGGMGGPHGHPIEITKSKGKCKWDFKWANETYILNDQKALELEKPNSINARLDYWSLHMGLPLIVYSHADPDEIGPFKPTLAGLFSIVFFETIIEYLEKLIFKEFTYNSEDDIKIEFAKKLQLVTNMLLLGSNNNLDYRRIIIDSFFGFEDEENLDSKTIFQEVFNHLKPGLKMFGPDLYSVIDGDCTPSGERMSILSEYEYYFRGDSIGSYRDKWLADLLPDFFMYSGLYQNNEQSGYGYAETLAFRYGGGTETQTTTVGTVTAVGEFQFFDQPQTQYESILEKMIGPDLSSRFRQHLEKYRSEYSLFGKDLIFEHYKNNDQDLFKDLENKPIEITQYDFWTNILSKVSSLSSQISPKLALEEEERKATEAADIFDLNLDACALEPEEEPEEDIDCSPCKPNACAIVPNWIELPDKNTFLNGRTCEFSTVVMTKYKDVKEKSAETIQQESVYPGLKSMLEFYGKEDDDDTILSIISKGGITTEYYLDTRSGTYLRVLIKAPYDDINNIPDKILDTGNNTPNSADFPLNVVINNADLRSPGSMFDLVAKAIGRKYATQYDLALAQNKLQGFPPSISLKNEGDMLIKFEKNLIKLVKKQGFRLNPLRKKLGMIDAVEIGFSDETGPLTIEYVKVNNLGCEAVSLVGGNGWTEFMSAESSEYPSTLAFVSNLPDIYENITSNNPLAIDQFLKTYYYPRVEVEPGNDLTYAQNFVDSNTCTGTELALNLLKGPAAFGADVVGHILDLPEIYAREFGKEACLTIQGKAAQDKALLEPELLEERKKYIEQKTYSCNDPVTQQLWESFVTGYDDKGGPPLKFKELREALDKLGSCGLAALISDAVKCIMRGLDYDSSLETFIRVFIRNASDKELEKLFFSVPPNIQQAIRDSVSELTSIPLPWEAGYRPGSYTSAGTKYSTQYFAQGEFGTGSVDERLDRIENNQNLQDEEGDRGRDKDDREGNLRKFQARSRTTIDEQQAEFNAFIPKPVLDENGNPTTDTDGNAVLIESPGGLVSAPGLGPRNYAGPFAHAGSVGTALDAVQDNITNVLRDAILGMIENNLISMDALKEFIETQIPLGSLFTDLANNIRDCPKPPAVHPPLDDVLKTTELDFCDGYYAIALPKIPKLKIGPFMGDLKATAIEALQETIDELAARAVTLVMQKIFKVLMNMACEVLKDTAGMIKDAAGGADFREIIAENICGDSFNDKALNDSLSHLLDALDVWNIPTAIKPSSDDIGDFIDGVASIMTQEEILDLMEGEPSPRTLLYARQIADGIPTIANMLPTDQHIKDLFIGLGNVFDKDKIRDRISDTPFTPVSPTICSTYESVNTFRKIREEILLGKGLTTKESKEQICMLKDLAMQDLDSLLCVLNDGVYGDVDLGGDECSLIPLETEVTKRQRAEFYDSIYETVNTAFLKELVTKKGLLNMILSDVKGRGLKKHSEFYVGLFGESLSSDFNGFLDKNADFSDTGDAEGVFPTTVGISLKNKLENLNASFDINSEINMELKYKGYESDEPHVILQYSYPSMSTSLNDIDISLMRQLDGDDIEVPLNYSVSLDKDEFAADIAQNQSGFSNQSYLFENVVQSAWSPYYSLAPGKHFQETVFNYMTSYIVNNMAKKMSENVRAFEFGFDPEAKGEVHYLDPEEYGGTEKNPPYYVDPPKYAGWLGMYDKIIPETDSCERVSIIDFESISNRVSAYADDLSDDPRLDISPDCGLDMERPFERIMPKDSLAGTWGAIMATIRVYATEAIIKGIPSFSLFDPSSSMYSDVLFGYVRNKIKFGLLQDGENFKTTTKREIYYLNFLEEVVQNFGKKVDIGEIVPSSSQLSAMKEINRIQSSWENPARGAGYKRRRKEQYENYIRSVEPEALVLLNYFIGQELEEVSSEFSSALKPTIKSLESWLFGAPTWMAAGALTTGGPLDVSRSPSDNNDPATNTILNLSRSLDDGYLPFILEKYVKASNTNDGISRVYNIQEFSEILKTQNGKLSDNWADISYGIRISMLMDDDFTSDKTLVDDSISELDVANTRSLKFGSGAASSKAYVVPLAEALNQIDTEQDTTFDIEGNYDVGCMLLFLIESPEYKILFNYCFPLTSILSFLTIYCIESFVLSIGEEWGDQGGIKGGKILSQFRTWDKGDRSFKRTKRLLRRLFNDFYHARDSSYQDPERETDKEKRNKRLRVKRKIPTDKDIKWWQRKMQRPKPADRCGE